MKKRSKKEQEKFYRNVGQAVCNVAQGAWVMFMLFGIPVLGTILVEYINHV